MIIKLHSNGFVVYMLEDNIVIAYTMLRVYTFKVLISSLIIDWSRMQEYSSWIENKLLNSSIN